MNFKILSASLLAVTNAVFASTPLSKFEKRPFQGRLLSRLLVLGLCLNAWSQDPLAIWDEALQSPPASSSTVVSSSSQWTTPPSEAKLEIQEASPQAQPVGPQILAQEPKAAEPEQERPANPSSTTTSKNINQDVVDLGTTQIRENKPAENLRQHLKSVQGTSIFEAKKTELITLDGLEANLATNNARQIFARVPGLNIWESDAAGLQMGIGARGLSPSRTSEFNTRHNGYDLSADALGYPESYYTPPAEALERIEIVRGAASLQYGTQFGGMINFVTKDAPKDKALEVVVRSSSVAYASEKSLARPGMSGLFGSIGGTQGIWSYYGFGQYKQGQGERHRTEFHQMTGFGKLKAQWTPELSTALEWTSMRYLTEQPGGLTDAMFAEDPLQVRKLRNWFQVGWNLGAFVLDYKPHSKVTINSRSFTLLASREALGNLSRVDRDAGGQRDYWSDAYTNFGSEIRLLLQDPIPHITQTFLVGGRFYKGHLNRMEGKADTTAAANFSFVSSGHPGEIDYEFPSINGSLFSESIFYLGDHWSITPGLRYEWIQTKAEGTYLNKTLRNQAFRDMDLPDSIKYIKIDTLPDSRERVRHFPLFGIGLSYKTQFHEFYTNASQNYRAMNFNDMRVSNPNFRVDSNLSDEKGFNVDLGARGRLGPDGLLLNYDISGFWLEYQDRIGVIWERDPVLNTAILRRTNISDSRNLGVESFFETRLLKYLAPQHKLADLGIFTSGTWIDASYIRSKNSALEGKRVELVPEWIWRAGFNHNIDTWRYEIQASYTGEHFTDATNARTSNDGIYGVIPSYWTMDATVSKKFGLVKTTLSCNNLLDAVYYSRRASGYPGPGIMPAEGRTVALSIEVKF
jgi:Fe(3+) dicitrate transport protein